MWLFKKVIVSVLIFTDVPSAFNLEIILDLTKFVSNIAPSPFPPEIVTFGFLSYPIPGEFIFTSSIEPERIKCALQPDPIESEIIKFGGFITS